MMFNRFFCSVEVYARLSLIYIDLGYDLGAQVKSEAPLLHEQKTFVS